MPHPSRPLQHATHATPDPDFDRAARMIQTTETFEKALDHLRTTDDRTLAEQCRLTEVPAPPFHEGARASTMAGLMRESGLVDPRIDAEGNVVSRYPESGATWGVRGAPARPPFVVAAHLDTVFPAGTDVTVRREHDRWIGPGIGDDGRGLAALLALARACAAGGVRPSRPWLFVATVGEEGAGDLRGVRHLFGPDGAARDATGFLSLDGPGCRRIVHAAVGSRRMRVTVAGPGGHSWIDWGTPNPIHALGAAIATIRELELPPETTVSVGRIGGGTSINAIPPTAWLEVEVRSRSEGALGSIEEQIRAALLAAVRDEGDDATLDVELFGDRPAGGTAADDALTRAAVAATSALGFTPELAASSTDANLPMARGIPALTFGAGGAGGCAHTPSEWYRNTDGPEGIARALLTLLVLEEVERGSAAPSDQAPAGDALG